jgi:prepilin-type N-terminal cleavage/methylation domain-containing protein
MIKRGLTLIELIVVIFLIGLIATFSVRLIPVTKNSYVRAELEKLYSSALYLQAQACREQRIHTLTIHLRSNTYSVGSFVHALHPSVIFGFKGGMYGPPSCPLKPLKDPLSFKHNSIVFYPDGTISAGALYLTDKDASCGYALTSGVTQVPYIRLYAYDKKWKPLT